MDTYKGQLYRVTRDYITVIDIKQWRTVFINRGEVVLVLEKTRTELQATDIFKILYKSRIYQARVAMKKHIGGDKLEIFGMKRLKKQQQ